MLMTEKFGILFTVIVKYKVSEYKRHGYGGKNRFAFQTCQFHKSGCMLCCPLLRGILKSFEKGCAEELVMSLSLRPPHNAERPQ